jgi:hypothetical protein
VLWQHKSCGEQCDANISYWSKKWEWRSETKIVLDKANVKLLASNKQHRFK